MSLMQRIACVLTIILLAGCAAGTVRQPQTAEQRAQARWEALLAGDWDAAYQMLTPGYRESTSLDNYQLSMLTRQVQWTAATVTSSSCENEDKCAVEVRIDYSVSGSLPGVPKLATHGQVEETWLRLDGQWYMLPRRAGR